MERLAKDRLDEDLNPVGRVFTTPTLFWTPASPSQEVGRAPEARAREKRICNMITSGGFRRLGSAVETSFSIIYYEARPLLGRRDGSRPGGAESSPGSPGRRKRRYGWSS